MEKSFISKYKFMKALYENRETSGEIIFRLLENAKITKKDWKIFIKSYKEKELEKTEHSEFDADVIEFCKEFADVSLPIPIFDNSNIEIKL